MITKRINSTLIDPPTNRHRVEITEESIEELAKDIRDRGLMNPITVRPKGERFEVVAGERRYTAMKYLGWPIMECRITAAISDQECEALRLAENLQRENLSPYEEAIQITALFEVKGRDPALVAKTCHRSVPWVIDRLQLFTIPDELQPLVHTKQLSIGAALALARIEDAPNRAYYTRLAMHDGCTVPVLSRWVNEYITQKLIDPTTEPQRPDMPQPGQPIVVYLTCDLCTLPADTRTRVPKFVCVNCQQIWSEFRDAYRAADEHMHSQPQRDQVPS